MSGTTMRFQGGFTRFPASPAPRRAAAPARPGKPAAIDRFIAGSQHVSTPSELAGLERLICVGSIACAAALWLFG